MKVRQAASLNREAGQSRRSLPVFSTAKRAWTIGEVLATAQHLGSAIRMPEPQMRGMPQPHRVADIDAAVQAFRYQHHLISAEECLNWLVARGLSYADLRASMARRSSAKPMPDPAAEQIDLLLSDEFAALARALASRVAVTLHAGATLSGAFDDCWPRMEARYRALATAAVDPLARQRLLQKDRLNWVQIEFEQIEFDRLDAAREARLCVLEDHQSLLELALAGGFAHAFRRDRVAALPPAWTQALLRTRPGAITPVISDGERQLLLAVTRIIEPSLDDAHVLSGIDAQLLDQQLQPLLAQHVHWLMAGFA